MPASEANPAARPWLRLREAIGSMAGPGVGVSARQAAAKMASVTMSGMPKGSLDVRGSLNRSDAALQRVGSGIPVNRFTADPPTGDVIRDRRVRGIAMRLSGMRLSWLVLLGLAACSPYSFPREVGAIGTGVDQLQNGFTSGFAALAADRTARIELELTGSRAKVAMASACLESPADAAQSRIPCELYRFGTPAPALSLIEQQRGKTMAAL